jgi:hypothetical protein
MAVSRFEITPVAPARRSPRMAACEAARLSQKHPSPQPTIARNIP